MNSPETMLILIFGGFALLMACMLTIGLKIAIFFNPNLLGSIKQHPYIFSYKVSGTFGVIIVAALFLTADSLETSIFAWVFSIGTALASAFAGLIVGGNLKSKVNKQ